MIWLILFLASFLRLINLNQSLWLDEAINVLHAKTTGFWWFITKYSIGDFHPPGWFAILWIWGHIFGFSEIIVRLPSVILGVVTVWLTYLIGKKLFNKRIGLIAALLLAIAPLHIYYSQEARMYSLSAFGVTLSFYFLDKLLSKEKWSLLGYTISLVLVSYADYLSILVIPAQIIYLVWINKINRKILFAYIITGVLFIPWLYVFPIQLQRGLEKAIIIPGWSRVVGGSNIKELILIPIKIFFGKITLLNKSLYFAISAFTSLLFGFLAFYSLKKLDQSTKLLLSWMIIPILLSFIISFFVPVLSYFRLLFVLPAFYLLIAKGMESLPKKIKLLILLLLVSISLTSISAYYINPKFQREDWRSAISFVSENLDDHTLIIFENNEIPAPVNYYSRDTSKFRPGLSINLTDDLEGKSRVYLFDYLVDIYDPNRVIEQQIKSKGFILKEIYDFSGVGFIKLYVKK